MASHPRLIDTVHLGFFAYCVSFYLVIEPLTRSSTVVWSFPVLECLLCAGVHYANILVAV